MWVFIVIHIALLIPSFLVFDNMSLFSLVMAFSASSVLYSVIRKGKGEWSMQGMSAVWVIGVLVVLSLMYANFLPHVEEKIDVFLNISSLAVLAVVILFMHIDNMRFSLGLMGEGQKGAVAASPVSNILISIFLAIIVIFGALSVLFPSTSVILALARFVREILLLPLRLLAALLQWLADGDVEISEIIPMIGAQEGDMPLEDGIPMDDAQHSWFMTLVNFLSIFIGVAIVVVIAAVLLYKLYKAFDKKDDIYKMQKYTQNDNVDRLKFMFGDFKELLPRFKLGTKHPVRRAYIKKINSHIKQGLRVRPHYTPEIIADQIRPKENIDELTQRYEEVRYGRL